MNNKTCGLLFMVLCVNSVEAEDSEMFSRDSLRAQAIRAFHFHYPYDKNDKGLRWWYRLNADTWVERYPEGITRFRIVYRATIDGVRGTVVLRVRNYPSYSDVPPSIETQRLDVQEIPSRTKAEFQVFIPDEGEKNSIARYRSEVGGAYEPWQILAHARFSHRTKLP